MVTKGQLKLITSLARKKYRDAHSLFIVEGPKSVLEFLNSEIELHSLFITKTYLDEIKKSDTNAALLKKEYTVINEKELQKMSQLQHANSMLAVFKIPASTSLIEKGMSVVLDGIRDPGNMGTIIRLCDWFGIKQLICSQDTVDCYNAKVVQATMGSLARVHVHYVDLPQFISNTMLPVYGGVLNGTSIYKTTFKEDGLLVLGNEGKGVSSEIIARLSHRITIPQHGISKNTESLNVATATAILLNEVRRPIEK